MVVRRERAGRRKATRRSARGPASGPVRSRAVAVRRALHSAYQLGDADVERFLVSGEYRGLLEDYFGDDHYRELSALAKQASRRAVRGGPRVLILPGIMGSRLGRARSILWNDVVWIDPFDIARGKLEQLAFGRDREIRALGVILFAYLKLKLRLVIAGFHADFHPFDWRRSLDELGADLVARMRADAAPEIHLIGHSMGAMVCRAAIAHDDRKLGRLVMLGPPNFGSFAPVQAIRATHPLVRGIAKLDLENSARELSEKVLKT